MSRRDVREAVRGATRLNLLERAIAAVAPVTAARRQQARLFMAMSGGYTGAARSRRQTSEWQTTRGASADADQLPDLALLRDRSRDLVRNEPLACGAISGVVTSVVGTGLALQSRVDRDVLRMSEEDAAAWQKRTESEWRLWAESTCCDATRTQNFYGLQALAFRSALESGDVFLTTPMRPLPGMPYQLALQIIESDQCSNPGYAGDTDTCAAGVELDTWRAPVAYYFRSSHPGALRAVAAKWERYAAFGEKSGRRQVIHLYDKLRPGQTRGVPYLSPVIETLKQLGRYTEAELMAAVISGMFTVFVTSERGGLDVNDPSGIGTETGAAAADKDVKLGAGAIVDLNPGEEVQFANPGRPNPAFNGFVEAMCRFIGIALELPYEILIKHFASSYSASRGAMLEAWKFYRRRRAFMADMLCGPVYEVWMDEAVARGRIAAPGYFDDALMRRAYLGAEWVGDGPISVDPLKDARAAAERVALGISTVAKESTLHDGGNWEDNHAQRVREVTRRRADGIETEPAPESPAADPALEEEQEERANGEASEAAARVAELLAGIRRNGDAMLEAVRTVGATPAPAAPSINVHNAPPERTAWVFSTDRDGNTTARPVTPEAGQ